MAYVGGTASLRYVTHMLMLLRIFGVWLLLLAMVAAVIDATKSLAGGGAWVVTPMGEQWQALNADSLRRPKPGSRPMPARSCGTR